MISATLTLELSMNGCRKAKVSCTKKREFNSKIRIFLKDFLALLKSLHVKNFIEKKTSWYDMRPLDQIGLVRKLEVVHKQVGGFMRRLYGQWRGYVVRYVGIELLGQLKRKTDNHFIFWSHIDCLCSSNTNECFFYSQPRSKFAISAFSRKKRIWSNFSPDKEDLWSVATSPPQENSFSTFVELGGGVKCRRTTFRRALTILLFAFDVSSNCSQYLKHWNKKNEF